LEIFNAKDTFCLMRDYNYPSKGSQCPLLLVSVSYNLPVSLSYLWLDSVFTCLDLMTVF